VVQRFLGRHSTFIDYIHTDLLIIIMHDNVLKLHPVCSLCALRDDSYHVLFAQIWSPKILGSSRTAVYVL